mmetsp:Transcript_1597/g.2193  ORF Transcript_1597/g.2193 Transcript_1597/m.2193 type:complete len:80 (+) Transcript_1597:89-328(+)
MFGSEGSSISNKAHALLFIWSMEPSSPTWRPPSNDPLRIRITSRFAITMFMEKLEVWKFIEEVEGNCTYFSIGVKVVCM